MPDAASPTGVVPTEALLGLLLDSSIVQRSGVASTACLVYDIMITMDQEVQYVWKASWTWPKALFIFTRYFALLVQIVNTFEAMSVNISDHFCNVFTIFESVSGQVLLMSLEIMLMLRVWALYKRDKRVLAFIVTLYLAEVITNTVIIGLAVSGLISVAPLRVLFPQTLSFSGCLPTELPGFFFSYWIPPLIFESILFIMMLHNFILHAREQRPTPIFTLFVRDGTLYYAVIFVVLLTQVLLYELVNSALAQFAVGWLFTTFSIAGSRIFLNLREAWANKDIDSIMMDTIISNAGLSGPFGSESNVPANANTNTNTNTNLQESDAPAPADRDATPNGDAEPESRRWRRRRQRDVRRRSITMREDGSGMSVGLVVGFWERMGVLLSRMMGVWESEGEGEREDGEGGVALSRIDSNNGTRGRGSMHDLEGQWRSREGMGGG